MVMSSSQPASSQPGEMDTRFAALLEPIRDMAKNWDIDIAHHLEEYLEEVCTHIDHFLMYLLNRIFFRCSNVNFLL